MTRLAVAIVLACAAAACGGRGPAPPVDVDVHADACASCRMAISDPSLAAQMTAPGDEPLFFDDIGCLASYLQQHPGRRADAAVYVADHRTRAWIGAADAVYARIATLETPMNSHLVAYADAASQAADARGATGARVAVSEIFGATLAAVTTTGRTP